MSLGERESLCKPSPRRLGFTQTFSFSQTPSRVCIRLNTASIIYFLNGRFHTSSIFSCVLELGWKERPFCNSPLWAICRLRVANGSHWKVALSRIITRSTCAAEKSMLPITSDARRTDVTHHLRQWDPAQQSSQSQPHKPRSDRQRWVGCAARACAIPGPRTGSPPLRCPGWVPASMNQERKRAVTLYVTIQYNTIICGAGSWVKRLGEIFALANNLKAIEIQQDLSPL